TISNYEFGSTIRLVLQNATGVWDPCGKKDGINSNGVWIVQWKGMLAPLKDGGKPLITFNTNLKADISIEKLQINRGTEYLIYTPAPSEDYENAYPDYIGLAPGYSDNPEDYVWLPEPNKNQKKLDELIELKDQVADMQTWIQAHS
ncbi:hypothetical protein, partial [Enterococcus asini]|uniref:hypothetical protein n=1 Tax=Enterococcus asini TaxID=57732 RepID=UPI0026DC3233